MKIISMGGTPSIIWTLLVGLVVGAVAKLIMPGKDPGGIIVTADRPSVSIVKARQLGSSGLQSERFACCLQVASKTTQLDRSSLTDGGSLGLHQSFQLCLEIQSSRFWLGCRTSTHAG
jgi:hypothetical protein